MADIKPFKGVLYNPDTVKDFSRVVAPPYDVISESMQDEYYKLHPNNIVRLTLGKKNKTDNTFNNRYTRARHSLDEWLKNNILTEDKEPSIYIYGQDYLYKGERKTRLGFISLMKIEDPHESRVLPHEYTLTKPKEDRLSLYKATNTNLSPIFSLFEDINNSVTNILKKHVSGKPVADIEQEGVRHRLWRLNDPNTIEQISSLIKDKQVFIADGHHRYEVALSFRQWARQKKISAAGTSPYDYVMVYFSGLDPAALTILSTHRVVRLTKKASYKEILSRLEAYFAIEHFNNRDEMFARIDKVKQGEYAYGMYYKDKGFSALTLKNIGILENIITQDKKYAWKWLDVTILHRLIFDKILEIKEKVASEDNIVYTREADHAVGLVDSGSYAMAFFQNPPRVEQVRDVARSHDRMPRKTTYFYPKLLSGLVFYKMV